MWVIEQLWDDYADDKWNKLIESMPERMQAVIDAKGGLMSY